MTDASRSILVAALVLLAILARMSIQAARVPADSPQRLISQLRVAQLAALMLALVAGAYVGLVALNAHRDRVAIDIVFALGFFVVAALASTRDPREALTILALAFIAHGLVDILHQPGMLADDLAPTWYLVGCSVQNLCGASLCYLPLLDRSA